MRRKLALEAFEVRLVPAALVKFTEVDGDRIVVRTNKGTTADLEAAIGFESGATNVDGFTVNLIVTTDTAVAFSGTNLKVTAAGRGNKLADDVVVLGYDFFSALRIDLGNVSVKGNLRSINAGDDDLGSPAIRNLTATNWVRGDDSLIHGDIGAVTVRGEFNGNVFSIGPVGNNYQDANGTEIGSFTCGRFGTFAANGAGHLQVHGIGKLTIKGTFSGDAARINNGLIEAVTIGKTIINEWTGGARIELG